MCALSIPGNMPPINVPNTDVPDPKVPSLESPDSQSREQFRHLADGPYPTASIPRDPSLGPPPPESLTDVLRGAMAGAIQTPPPPPPGSIPIEELAGSLVNTIMTAKPDAPYQTTDVPADPSILPGATIHMGRDPDGNLNVAIEVDPSYRPCVEEARGHLQIALESVLGSPFKLSFVDPPA
jgi:hypothetical protein